MQALQRAQRRRGRVDDVQPRRQRRAVQAARIDDTLRLVGRKSQRQGVDHFAPLRPGPGAALGHDAADVMLFDGAAVDRPLHVEQPRFRLAAGQVHRHRTQPGVGHVLGLADAGADRSLGFFQIDNAADTDPSAAMPTEAKHAQGAVAFGAADQAGDLGRADIQHAERAGAMLPRTIRLIGPVIGGGSTRCDMSFIARVPCMRWNPPLPLEGGGWGEGCSPPPTVDV